MMPSARAICFATSLLLIPSAGFALDINFNGFASVVGGKVLSGRDQTYGEWECPCYVADYPFVGVYTDEWTFDADSTLALQANARITDDFSVTAQLVSHGSDEYKLSIDWAYFSYNLTDQWTLQGGRKRAPLFYYSDFFDVGYAVPWIRAPGDLYGWQIVSYTGANLLYTGNWGVINVTGNIWMGKDEDENNQELSRIYYGVQVDETWKDQIGGYLDLNYEWLTVRAVYMTNKVDRLIYDESPPRQRLLDTKQNFWGVTVNVDVGNLIIRSEYNTFDRPSEGNTYVAYLAGIGYRFGDWLPMISYSSFEEEADEWPNEVEIHDTLMYSLRWDFTTSAALKIQYDVFTDDTLGDWFVGDSKTLAIGIDVVF